jgi:carbon storage regulator
VLILSRFRDESIIVDTRQFGYDPIVITVIDIRGGKVRIGVTAHTDIVVDREEIFERRERDRNGRRLPPPLPGDVP